MKAHSSLTEAVNAVVSANLPEHVSAVGVFVLIGGQTMIANITREGVCTELVAA